jgi:hypothetical protein
MHAIRVAQPEHPPFGLLCRRYLGWTSEIPALQKGSGLLERRISQTQTAAKATARIVPKSEATCLGR